MSRLVKGPFSLKYGDNTIDDVESMEVSSDISRDDLETVQGHVITVDGARKATIKVTLLASDIPALAAIMPQYFVPDGGILSTGETVNHAEGAIDIAAAVACSQVEVHNHLDIAACGAPQDVFRLVNARTSFEDITFDKIRKVGITFIGDPQGDDGLLQFFRQGTIAVVS